MFGICDWECEFLPSSGPLVPAVSVLAMEFVTVMSVALIARAAARSDSAAAKTPGTPITYALTVPELLRRQRQ
jgi:hypothetical protein